MNTYESKEREKTTWMRAEDFGFENYSFFHPTDEAYRFLVEAINRELLPFKPIFYLTLEKESFDEAEIVRRNWVSFLNYLTSFFEFMNKKIPSSPSAKGGKPVDIASAVQRIQLQLEKLSVVGLTDPLLITLRREMVGALKEKRWDDAQKIQNIIVGRVKELTPPVPPPQPQVQIVEKVIEKPVEKVVEKVVEKETPQRVVVVQPPSEQHLKVEQLPRYGVTDVGRALSVIGGRPLSEKDAATLKRFDILLGR